MLREGSARLRRLGDGGEREETDGLIDVQEGRRGSSVLPRRLRGHATNGRGRGGMGGPGHSAHRMEREGEGFRGRGGCSLGQLNWRLCHGDVYQSLESGITAVMLWVGGNHRLEGLVSGGRGHGGGRIPAPGVRPRGHEPLHLSAAADGDLGQRGGHTGKLDRRTRPLGWSGTSPSAKRRRFYVGERDVGVGADRAEEGRGELGRVGAAPLLAVGRAAPGGPHGREARELTGAGTSGERWRHNGCCRRYQRESVHVVGQHGGRERVGVVVQSDTRRDRVAKCFGGRDEEVERQPPLRRLLRCGRLRGLPAVATPLLVRLHLFLFRPRVGDGALALRHLVSAAAFGFGCAFGVFAVRLLVWLVEGGGVRGRGLLLLPLGFGNDGCHHSPTLRLSLRLLGILEGR